jgi:hypothetical protein
MTRRVAAQIACSVLLCLGLGAGPALAAEVAGPPVGTPVGTSIGTSIEEDASASSPSFEEGDVIALQGIDALRPYLPEEFWNNRDFFFYEGMRLEVGPFQRDYSPAAVFQAATAQHLGKASIGPDNSLEGYIAGQPFPIEQIDCAADPQAGVKLIWNFDYAWQGAATHSSFYYSYWDRGEKLPLYYEGKAQGVLLSNRPEPQHAARKGDLFRGEARKFAFGAEVEAPFDARGIMLLSYRYKSTDLPRAKAHNDDTWVYVPTLRRVRRISTAQRTDSVSGTDFTFDDLRGFAGIIPQYEWKCLGEMDLMAPVNTKALAYPYDRDHNFGPFGLSFADDRWEMRRAIKVRMTPKNEGHPYQHKDLYIDKETLKNLYAFAYDRKGELWKIIWHNRRWSGDELTAGSDPGWYPGWEGVDEVRDSRIVSDIIVNVQTGTGNRIEFWDSSGEPFKTQGQVRRYISVGRLTGGR